MMNLNAKRMNEFAMEMMKNKERIGEKEKKMKKKIFMFVCVSQRKREREIVPK